MSLSPNYKTQGLSLLMQAGLQYNGGKSMEAMQNLREGVKLLFKPPTDAKPDAQRKAEKEKLSEADVLSFSGCRDDQTSADAKINGEFNGAMSNALIAVLSSHTQGINFTDLLFAMRNHLNGKYTQVPQMSSGRLVDLNAKFCL
jgi:hypothetical protein